MRNNLTIKYEEILRNAGLRNTRPKRQVFERLLVANSPLLTKTIAHSLPDIAQSTVYRVLQSFVRANIVKIVPRGFKTLYELSEDFNQHHHHVSCEKCGRSVAIHSAELEQMLSELTLRSGMRPTRHHLELYGLCKRCVRRPKIKFKEVKNVYKI
jgi:Fe2+ or Zn2+ uptake regulation protein